MQDEVYKWKLVKNYKGRPDINAKDFTQELKSIKFQNLLYAMSIAVTNQLAKEKPEEYRKLFISLFDESTPLNNRVKNFNGDSLKLYRSLGETLGHHQDERSIATYLTLHNPLKYTFYKSTFYKEFCKLMGVEPAGKNEKYAHYLLLLNQFIENYIVPDKELTDTVKSYISEYYDGTNNLLLAQDILYCMLNKAEDDSNYWIFQGNLKIYDVVSALNDNALKSWSVKAHKDSIQIGDKVILWVSGNKAGCYALAQVTSGIFEAKDDVSEMRYYVDSRENEISSRVSIKITHNLAANPILKDQIQGIKDLNLLKAGSQGTNFKATKIEYLTFLKLAEKNMTNRKYWLYAPGKNADRWDEFLQEGIMGLNWDNLGNLNKYSTKKDIATRLQVLSDSDSSKSNDAKACYDFVHVVKEGDIVFVKKGNSALLGYGIVTGPAVFNEQRVDNKNIRGVDWKLKGEWDPEHKLVQKTLTDITDFPTEKLGFKHYYERLFASMGLNINQSISLNTSLTSSYLTALKKPNTTSISTDFHAKTSSAGLIFSQQLIQRFIASLCTKPFVICSGLSGSGKTKLAQAFAQWICYKEEDGVKNEQYCIVPVGADWTNREPLLGYPNALQEAKYVKPENGVLDLINRARLNEAKPYFLILDEMNLSHVERYFADFLSTMESGDAIPLHTIDNEESGIPKQLKLPKNLFIIGTVNIDETTYMFSPKVLDRANTIEFRLTEKNLEDFIDSKVTLDMDLLKGEGVIFGEGFIEMARRETDKKNLKKVETDLKDFFKELKKSGAEFGYRSASEIGRLMFMLEELGEKEDNLLDIAIMQKLLPKIHGSRNKLSKVLPVLGGFCLKNNELIKEKYLDMFVNNTLTEEILNKDSNIKYRISFEKICRMYKNAVENGFASYAEA